MQIIYIYKNSAYTHLSTWRQLRDIVRYYTISLYPSADAMWKGVLQLYISVCRNRKKHKPKFKIIM